MGGFREQRSPDDSYHGLLIQAGLLKPVFMEQVIEYGWMLMKALGILLIVCLVIGGFIILFLDWAGSRKDFPVMDGSDEDDMLFW